jgi:hypothetical protein
MKCKKNPPNLRKIKTLLIHVDLWYNSKHTKQCRGSFFVKNLWLLLLLFPMNTAFADNVCEFEHIVGEIRQNCSGINMELQQIKKYAIANVVVTGVGTVAGGGALYAGIKKKDFDKKAEEIIKKMDSIESMSDAEFVRFLKEMARYQDTKEEYDTMCQLKHNYEAQAKKLGKIRTGLLAGNTATAVAGTVISTKNRKDSGSIKDMIQQCLDSIKANEQRIGQAIADCDSDVYKKINNIVSNCRSLSVENMEKVYKQTTASTVVSGVNIGTGAAGTITSVLANRNQYDQKTKNLNKAANVLAGTSAVASGVSTVFNAATLKSIDDNLKASDNCEKALNNL